MTGQVKEDILSRFGELGVFVSGSRLIFNPRLLRKEEFIEGPGVFGYVDVHAEKQQIPLEPGSLCFTYCQVPILYTLSGHNGLEVVLQDGTSTRFEALELDARVSEQVFARTGEVRRIIVQVDAGQLK